jgi:hypothetical protein
MPYWVTSFKANGGASHSGKTGYQSFPRGFNSRDILSLAPKNVQVRSSGELGDARVLPGHSLADNEPTQLTKLFDSATLPVSPLFTITCRQSCRKSFVISQAEGGRICCALSMRSELEKPMVAD